MRGWKIISLVGSFPPTILLTAVLITLTTSTSFRHVAMFGFIFSVLPTVIALYFLRTGRISDIEIRDKDERQGLFAIAIVVSLAGVVVLDYLAVSGALMDLAVIQAVLVPLLAFINQSWKISVHTTTWGACVTALSFIIGPVSLVGGLFAVLVGMSRIRLDCHTWGQVVGGFVVGVVLAALVVLR